MISNLFKKMIYSSQPKVTLFDFFASLNTRLSALELAAVRVGRGAIGEVFYFSGPIVPTGALVTDGSAIPRASYPVLHDAIAPVISGLTFAAGNTVVSGLPVAIIAALGGNGTKSPQIPVEGAGLPAGCKIASVSGTTVTLSAAPTASGTSMRIYFFGNGDGSTTYNIPEGRAEFWRGVDLGRGVDALRVLGAAQLDQMQRITGATQIGNNYREAIVNPTGVFSASDSTTTNAGVNTGGTVGSLTLNFDSATAPGARAGAETRPRNVSMLPCIWAF